MPAEARNGGNILVSALRLNGIDPSVFQYQLDFIDSQGDDIGDLTPQDLYTNEFIDPTIGMGTGTR